MRLRTALELLLVGLALALILLPTTASAKALKSSPGGSNRPPSIGPTPVTRSSSPPVSTPNLAETVRCVRDAAARWSSPRTTSRSSEPVAGAGRCCGPEAIRVTEPLA
jgi:hypothetical protein